MHNFYFVFLCLKIDIDKRMTPTIPPQQKLNFSKYSGCGNDFILINNLTALISLSASQISKLCSRKSGIGADGVILLETSSQADFKMRIFNADGSEAEMCGNGIRCLVDFAKKNGFINSSCTIESFKRIHHATWERNNITVSMGNPTDVVWNIELPISSGPLQMSYLDTGVPHAVIFCKDVNEVDLNSLGSQIRYHPYFTPRGTNVNIVQVKDNNISVRTYERGVEAETDACGTGATASAIASAQKLHLKPPIKVDLRSGESLTIDFHIDNGTIANVKMSGGCTHIFEGFIETL